jgi:DNA-binding response OmpR family regulator
MEMLHANHVGGGTHTSLVKQKKPRGFKRYEWPDYKKKILVIDDEPNLLNTLNKRLSAHGYEVFLASTGTMGLSVAKEEIPDLIILDVVMPDVRGDDVAVLLKKNIETCNIPILFLSCLLTRRGTGGAVGNVGRDVYMGKPYQPHQLMEKIREMI